jgi:hypothetical protein
VLADAKAAIERCKAAPKDRPLVVVLGEQRVLSPADTRDLLELMQERSRSKAQSLAVCGRVENGEALVAFAADRLFIVHGSKISGAAKTWCPNEGETAGYADRLVKLVHELSRIDGIFCERLLREDSPLSFQEPLVFVREESGGQFIASRGMRLSIDTALAKKISPSRVIEVDSIDAGIAEAKKLPADIATAGGDDAKKPAVPKPSTPKVPQPVDAELASYRTTLGELKQAIRDFEPYYLGRPGAGVWTGRKGIRAVWKAGNTDMTRDGKTKTKTGRMQTEIREHASTLIQLANTVARKSDDSHPSLGRLRSNVETLESIRKAIEKNDADLFDRTYKAVLGLSAP